MRQGATLEQALEGCLDDLDGFYTFAVGTADGFAVLRDPIACKPAVMAETDEWVAMASEYRAIAVLPGAEDAVSWEPDPGDAYTAGAPPWWRDGHSRATPATALTFDLRADSVRDLNRRLHGPEATGRLPRRQPRRAPRDRGRRRRRRAKSRSTATSATTARA